MGIEYEVIPIALFGIAGLILMLVPFLDRNINRTGRSPIFSFIGWIGLGYMVALTGWGYRSWVPLLAVALTCALIALMSLAMGPETALSNERPN